MSAITLDFPLDGLTHLKLREGQTFRGCIRNGKLHVTIPIDDVTEAPVFDSGAFVDKWSGKGEILPDSEVQTDPRLADLTAKHLR